MDFTKEYKKYLQLFDGYLQEHLSTFSSLSNKLDEAIKYSLLSGGKRLRPVLFLAVYDYFSDKNTDEFIQKKISCAIELLHNYTLIHDDLPSLDNDDFRRGRPSCHKAYGEAMAVLAGDSLLNESFSLLLECCIRQPNLIKAAHKFSILSGSNGLIGGQAKELQITRLDNKEEISEDVYLEIYKNKTASLFAGSALLGAAAANAYSSVDDLMAYATNFGMAFQLKDDLSDNNKESFAFNFGFSRTQELLNYYSAAARKLAKDLGNEFLLKLVDFEKYL